MTFDPDIPGDAPREIEAYEDLDVMDNDAEEFGELLSKLGREASTDHPDSDFGVSVDGSAQSVGDINEPIDGYKYYISDINATVLYLKELGKFEIVGVANVHTEADRPDSDLFTAGSEIIVRETGEKFEVTP